MHHFFDQCTKTEISLFKKLNSPQKIQGFLESLPINFEENGDTLYSPRTVLKHHKAHCLEGALLAASILLFHKKPALILDLQPGNFPDDGHAVALFKDGNYWGAISKTNHAVLRFRDAVYASPRELVMSYFHEYFLDDGRKTLRKYTVLDLKKIKQNWITDKNNVWYIDKTLSHSIYTSIAPRDTLKKLRTASRIEIQAGNLVEWKKKTRHKDGLRN